MKTDYISMEPFEVRCQWRRPEKSSSIVSGIVGFDGMDVVARMDEWLGPEKVTDLPRADILHAETNDGVDVTVYDVFVSRFTSDIRLVANAMAVGGHLNLRSKQMFTEADARINGLDTWWRTTLVQPKVAKDGSAVINCAAPSSINFTVPERSISISLREDPRWEIAARDVNIAYDPYVRFAADDAHTIDWFREIVDESRQLLSLFYEQDAALVSLRTKPKDDENAVDRVEWYWNRRDAKPREIRSSRILLPYDDVKQQFQHVLRKWLSKTEYLRHARALLFSTQANPAPFLETKFLPIIQAIEVYCGACGSEKYIAESEFETLKGKLFGIVPNGIDDRLKDKLRSSIGYANEQSLKDRILQLLNSLERNTRRFVCNDAETFARRLKDSRNYYTHYSGSKGKELKGKALHWATEQASLLLKIVMLKDCGISESLIQKALEQSGYHSQSVRIWEEIEKEL